jgi:heme/copper-type cytochrome/quinol oxidase subunit 3
MTLDNNSLSPIHGASSQNDSQISASIVRKHPYHLIDPSPWPFVGSLGAFVLAIGGVLAMHHYGTLVLWAGLGIIMVTAIGWWRDVFKESTPLNYTSPVQNALRYGMLLFIISEIMFFAGFFWAYFHSSLFPTEAVGFQWPPKGIKTIDAFKWPYLNTLLLLLSGTTVTWAHHSLLANRNKELVQGLLITVGLGALFTVIQAFEYHHAPFTIKDGIYPSTFYLATGFHGFHVLIGTIFLTVCLWKSYKKAYTTTHHISFEAAAWYWHFVDVVWLFLFISIYWAGQGIHD